MVYYIKYSPTVKTVVKKVFVIKPIFILDTGGPEFMTTISIGISKRFLNEPCPILQAFVFFAMVVKQLSEPRGH